MDASNFDFGQYIKERLERSWSWYRALKDNQRSYVNGAVCLAGALLLRPLISEWSDAFLFFAALFWGAAMIADLATLYRLVTGTMLGKLLLIGVVAVPTTISFAIAAQTVNLLIGVNPSQFTHTIAFIAVLVAVPLVAAGMYVVLVLGMAFLLMYVLFHLLPNENARLVVFPWYKSDGAPRHRAITAFVQVVSFVSLSIAGFHWSQATAKDYWEFTQDKGRWFLYTFETFEKAPCALEKGQKVAFLGGDNVLVATKAGEEITFSLRECKGG